MPENSPFIIISTGDEQSMRKNVRCLYRLFLFIINKKKPDFYALAVK